MEIENSRSGKNKIISIQALRGLAFLGVFFAHAESEYLGQYSAVSVSIFFIMSGLLLIYTYNDRPDDLSVLNNFKFAISHIKKLYPLHILMMLFMVLAELYYAAKGNIINGEYVLDLLKRIILNAALLQAWNSYWISFNFIAWYFSAIFFLYFIFHYVKKVISFIKPAFLLPCAFLIVIIQTVFIFAWIRFTGADIFTNAVDYKVFLSCVYFCPAFRAGDFIVGCLLGKYYLENKDRKYGVAPCTIAESLVLIGTIFMSRWILYLDDAPYFWSVLLRSLSVIYVPVAACWVFLFTVGKGWISRLLCNRAILFLGNISPYTFLIHYIVIFYVNSVLLHFGIVSAGLIKSFVIAFDLVLSVILGCIWVKLKNLKK